MKYALALLVAVAASATSAKTSYIALGTGAGAIPDPARSQPAGLIRAPGVAILIDAGDGAAEQLAKAHIPLASLDAVVISHLHFDHTGGLFAILGLRYQVRVPRPLMVFGPPGTKAMVAGLIEAMQPGAEVGAGLPGRPARSPEGGVTVVELSDGGTAQIGPAKLTVAANSHYSFPPRSPEAQRFQSLSLRFDLPERSVVVTGDTGPSAAVERLAKGADLLVSEIIDADAAIALLRQANPGLPDAAAAMLRPHFTEQHLSAEAVGELAARAGVKELVLSHNGLGGTDPAAAIRAIARTYHGTVHMARDLDAY